MGKLLRFVSSPCWTVNCQSAPSGLAMPATTVKAELAKHKRSYCHVTQASSRVSGVKIIKFLRGAQIFAELLTLSHLRRSQQRPPANSLAKDTGKMDRHLPTTYGPNSEA